MRIDIWSDFICPFCTIGERHLSLALADFEQRDDVEIVWRSFQLDPFAPQEGMDAMEYFTKTKGIGEERATQIWDGIAARAAQVDLDFNWRDAVVSNTYDLHRASHYARENGLGNAWEDAVKLAFFTEGKDLSERETLHDIATQIGLDRDGLDAVLDSDQYADTVQEEIDMARKLGIYGVPFFIFNNQLAVSGAQPVEVFKQALAQA